MLAYILGKFCILHGGMTYKTQEGLTKLYMATWLSNARNQSDKEIGKYQ